MSQHATSPAPDDDLITGSTSARILNRAESTVRYFRDRGLLRPAHRTPSGITLYWRAEVERLRDELNGRHR